MSLLNQLFNRGVFGAKCKTCLTLAISRIKLLQNKRELQLKQMRKEIAQFLQAGQEAIARIRVEHVIREQNICTAYSVLELFCEFVLARVPILENQKDCPTELREAIASIIFAAPRCSDLPDLLQIKNLFTSKYGKEYVAAIAELRPDTSVNRTIIEKLSVSAPSPEARLSVLKEIAEEYNVVWDSFQTEAALNKKHEDLLGGSKEIYSVASTPQASIKPSSPRSSTSNGAHPILPSESRLGSQHLQIPSPTSIMPILSTNEIEQSAKSSNAVLVSDTKMGTTSQSSDVLERARAAIASAERASAAARAAAQLVNAEFGLLKLEGKSS
ncbi:IST1 homolog [Mangifera indica]|uniref:IST1 homolog n=1 Tax=Mangifera indica TaxID=29780 RepID=UPI001CFA6579|nr:IST1 homolog [Mangifera indica]